MTKQALKEEFKNYIVELAVRMSKIIDAFPDDIEYPWGWSEVWKALKFCTGCGHEASVEKVIKNIKMGDTLNDWEPEPDNYTFQEEVKNDE